MHNAYISLGSNLNEPIKQVQYALKKIASLADTFLIKVSHFYWSESLLQGQPRYCNAVAQIQTLLAPEFLLNELQKIEFQQGRLRTEKWQARIIDLDILLYENKIINSNRLQIPHPELLHRNFCLYPLAELIPNLTLPKCNKPLAEMLNPLLPEGLEIISEVQ